MSWNAKNIFKGTAYYYRKYRPTYPDAIIQRLREEFNLTNDSRVLDLGCGTGQIALKLAPIVKEIIAVDPQSDMLAEGKIAASTLNIENIRWEEGSSKTLQEISSLITQVDLTTIGRAFHWMDRLECLNELWDLTTDGGGVAILGDSSYGKSVKPYWREKVMPKIEEILGERKAGISGKYSHPTKNHYEILQESHFSRLKKIEVEFDRHWTIDQIMGYLYSTSYASLPVLGNKKAQFEASIRELLESFPKDDFVEQGIFEILIGRKT